MNLQEARMREMEEQNKMLDELHRGVTGTRDAALRMSSELEDQDKMIDQLNAGVNAVNYEAKSQTTNILKLVQESKHRGFIGIIVVLVLIIIVLLFL